MLPLVSTASVTIIACDSRAGQGISVKHQMLHCDAVLMPLVSLCTSSKRPPHHFREMRLIKVICTMHASNVQPRVTAPLGNRQPARKDGVPIWTVPAKDPELPTRARVDSVPESDVHSGSSFQGVSELSMCYAMSMHA